MNSLTVTQPKKSQYTGRVSAYINSNNHRGRIAFKAGGKLRLPFNTDVREFDGQKKCQLVVSLDADNEVAVALQHRFEALQEGILQEAAAAPLQWLGQSLADKSPEKRLQIAQRQFSGPLKKGTVNERTGEPYADTLRFKMYLNSATGYPEIPARLKRGSEPRTVVAASDIVDLLAPNTRVKLVFSFGPIWFKRAGRLNTFGLPLVVQAIEIFPYERVTRVVPLADFRAGNLVFSDDRKNTHGSPTFRVGYENLQTRVTLQTPWAFVMGNREGGGVEIFPDSPQKPYMRLSFRDQTPETARFLAVLDGLETELKRVAVARSAAWFTEQVDAEDIGDFFNPLVRQIGDNKDEPVDPREPKYVKFKLPLQNADAVATTGAPATDWRTTFQDRNGVSIDGADVYELLRRETRARVTLQTCPGYVMSSSNFGVPLEAVAVELDVDATLPRVASGGGDMMDLFDDDPVDVAAAARELGATTTSTPATTADTSPEPMTIA